MKTALAVIVAFVFLLIGWLFLLALLFGVGYVASQARQGVGLMHILHVLLIWFLAPGFGGFLATFITPKIFREVDVATLATSFISVVVTLAVVMGLLSLFYILQEKVGINELVISTIQVVAIVVGAKIGKSSHIESDAYQYEKGI